MKRVRKMLAMMLMFLLAVGSGISGIKAVSRSGSVNAYKNSDWSSNVYVDELWDYDAEDSTKTGVNTENLAILIKYLTGGNASALSTMANQNANANVIRSKTVNAGSVGNMPYSAKQAGQGVIVKLGGLDWQVVYLTKSKTGKVIATLYLANSYQQDFADNEASYSKGDYFGFKDGVMYSDWAANWYSAWDETTTPSAMYGRSYINAVTLNNGGDYWYSSNGQNDSDAEVAVATANQDANSAFAKFTMSSVAGSVTSILATPNDVLYQQYGQSMTKIADWSDMPNENYGSLTIDPDFSATNGYEEIKFPEEDEDYDGDGYYSMYYARKVDALGNKYSFYAGADDEGGCWESVRDYSGITGNDDWADSYLWLPSMSETGYTGQQGIWGLNVTERSSLDGNWINVNNIETADEDISAITPCWLRSGDGNNAFGAYGLAPSGNNLSVYDVDYSCAVRPSLHLNLTSASDSEFQSARISAEGVGDSQLSLNWSTTAGVNSVKSTITEISFEREIPMGFDSGAGINVVVGSAGVQIYISGTKLAIVSQFDVQLSANSSSMFSGFSALTKIDFNNMVDASLVTNASSMFGSCPNLTSIDMSTLSFDSLTTTTSMFDSNKLVAIKTPKLIKNGTSIPLGKNLFYANSETAHSTISNEDAGKILKASWGDDYGYLCNGWQNALGVNLAYIKTLSFETSLPAGYTTANSAYIGSYLVDTDDDGVGDSCGQDLAEWYDQNYDVIGYYKPNGTYIDVCIICEKQVQLPKNCGWLFGSMNVAIRCNLSNTLTDYVTDMSGMFAYSPKLKSLTFGDWDTSKVENFNSTFLCCASLTSINLSSWDVSACQNFASMFNMTELKWNDWFTDPLLKTLNLSGWVIDSEAEVTNMFGGCVSLKTIFLPININGLTIDLPEDNTYYFLGSEDEATQEGEETTLSDTGSGYSVLQLNGTVYPSFPNTGVGVDIILPSAMILTLTVAICVVAFGGKKKKVIVKK